MGVEHGCRPQLQCFARSGRKVQDIWEDGLMGLDRALGDVVLWRVLCFFSLILCIILLFSPRSHTFGPSLAASCGSRVRLWQGKTGPNKTLLKLLKGEQTLRWVKKCTVSRRKEDMDNKNHKTK
jgi:hypothetical protein